MRRAWKQRIVVAAALTFAPRAALAFHAGSTFDKPPGAGGGGGVFYTGAPGDRGFTCAACHLNAPGKIRISLSESTGTLFTNLRYSPGATYPMTATLKNDPTTIDHLNSIAVTVVDDAGNPAGTIGGFSPDDFYQGSSGTIVAAGTKPNVTTWTFSWTAPQNAIGPVHLHVASVAGNAAGLPGLTLTDPFGDDVFAGTLDLDPDGRTSSRDGTSSPLWAGLGLLFFKRRKEGPR